MYYTLNTFSDVWVQKGYLNNCVQVLLTLVFSATSAQSDLVENKCKQAELKHVQCEQQGVYAILTHTKQASLPTFLFAVYPYALCTLQLS